MLNTAALVAGLQLLSSAAVVQAQTRFSADAAVAIDAGGGSGGSGFTPSVRNRAAVTVSGFASSETSSETSGSAESPAADEDTGEDTAEDTGGDTGGDTGDVELQRQDLIPVDSYVRVCDCKTVSSVETDDIRGISDQFCSDGNAQTTAGHSNMVWGFGQFLDHDLALTIEDEDGPTLAVGADTGNMDLHRAVTTSSRGCKTTLNVHTPRIDAGPIYGSDESYTQGTLREPGSCRMRVAEGDLLPLTTSADDEGRFFFIAGDVRVSEHAFLAAQHTVWLREHNRLCGELEGDSMSADAQFDLVRDVVIAKFQQVVLEEFLPSLGITEGDLRSATRLVNTPGMSIEFSIAYRLGHDLIGNDVGGMSIADAFNSEDFFLDQSGTADAPSVTYKANAASTISDIMSKLASTKANKIDGKLSDALRNSLFGEGEDLAGRNIFRGRDLGIPTYAGLAECYGTQPDAAVEAETPDPWLGLLREPKVGSSPLPPTLRAILIEQFHRSFFGPGGFYWKDRRSAVAKFEGEIASSTYAKIISANTGASVSGNAFNA